MIQTRSSGPRTPKAPLRNGYGRTVGGLVLLFAGLAVANPAPKEPDVADLPPEFAQYVAELRIRAVRESDGRPVPHTALKVDGGNEAFGRWQKTITTDADGRAAVRLPMGRYRAYPLADAFAFAWSDTFELDPSLPSVEVKIPLKPACTLAGRVVDDRGKPLAGSDVDVWADAGELHLVADGAGRFRVDRLTEGDHVVTARAAGFSARTASGLARPGRPGQVVITLRRGAKLTAVTECGGGPCRGARVSVDAPDDGGRAMTVEADGSAAFRDLPAGTVTIRAVHGEDLAGELVAAPIERQLAPGEVAAVKVVLEPSGGPFVVRGSVLDKAGKPLVAAIWATCGGVRRRLNYTEKDGTFVLRDLPTDHCKIDVSAENEHATLESNGPGPVRFVIDPWRPR
jgi:hypothetical protein